MMVCAACKTFLQQRHGCKDAATDVGNACSDKRAARSRLPIRPPLFVAHQPMDDRPIEMIGGEHGIRARTADRTGTPIHASTSVGRRVGARVAGRFIAILDRAETLHAAMPLSEQRLELSNEKVKSEQRVQQFSSAPKFKCGRVWSWS
jgi:hypothetical protein